MSPTTTGARTPYLSNKVPANASARVRFARQPMTGMAPRAARLSATDEPNPPDPPARMTVLPFTVVLPFLSDDTKSDSKESSSQLHVNASDESRVNGLPGQRLQFVAHILPPAFDERLYCRRYIDVR